MAITAGVLKRQTVNAEPGSQRFLMGLGQRTGDVDPNELLGVGLPMIDQLIGSNREALCRSAVCKAFHDVYLWGRFFHQFCPI
jgi:hypothetical protein